MNIKVEYINHMGDDLLVVNSARVSFKKFKTELDDKDKKLIKYLAGHGHWCYDEKTEIFTDSGWKYFKDLSLNDLVAQVNCEDFSFEFKPPQKIHSSDYSGKMYLCNNNKINYCVTPGHKMLIQTRLFNEYSDYKVMSSDDSFKLKSKRMKQSAKFIFNSNSGSYDEGYYYGFLLGDGFRLNNSTVSLRLKRKKKILSIENNIKLLGYSYTKKIKNNITQFYIKDKSTILEKAHLKSINIDLTKKSENFCRGLFDGLIQSDGTEKHSGYIFSTSSLQLLHNVEYLSILLGYKLGKISKRHLNNENHNINYRLPILSKDTGIIYKKRDEKEILYTGKVYCVTVDSGFVLVRRDGKPLVCGNTPFSHPQITLLVTCPIFVARQAFKHKVGLTENEVSRRYVDDDPEYFRPDFFRYRAENKKQGSKDGPMESNYLIMDELEKVYKECDRVYKWMLQRGVCPEQARMVLPQGMLTQFYWTGSLAAFARIYKLRISPDAQVEIQTLAKQIGDIIKPLYPESWEALTDETDTITNTGDIIITG